MSTSRKRLTSAIQRIAKEDTEIRKLLDDYRNSGGKPSESATSGSGAEDRRTCCDGGTGGTTSNPNPGSDTRVPDGGGQDGLDPDDPAKTDQGEGALDNITNCANDDPICFEGDDWVPPDGWESPTDPPVHYSYQVGYVWTGNGGTTYHASAELGLRTHGAYECLYECGGGIQYQGDPPFYAKVSGDCFDTLGCWGTISTDRVSCEDAGNPSACDDPPPTVDAWPSDGCINLALKAGKLVGSKFDPENDGTYSKPMTEIELCDGNGNKIGLKPSASGGWKTLDLINGGDGYLYDSQGQQISRISGAEYSDPNV